MNSKYTKPYDRHYCFFIQDFWPGDCIIVKSKEKRIRGVVEKADHNTMLIQYRDTENELSVASINDIILLQPFQRNWLSKS